MPNPRKPRKKAAPVQTPLKLGNVVLTPYHQTRFTVTEADNNELRVSALETSRALILERIESTLPRNRMHEGIQLILKRAKHFAQGKQVVLFKPKLATTTGRRIARTAILRYGLTPSTLSGKIFARRMQGARKKRGPK
ncbi:MAG: hypothetical protein HY393_02050 [Candidatus Diapherotrites archaeon]|nr:hypothetical protein [Candidatus Diapherotrites archaeon]